VATAAVAHSANISVNTSIDDEGLVSVEAKGLNHVYARPGVDLSLYVNVILDPVEVSFSEGGNRMQADTGVTVAQKQLIKRSLAKLFRAALAKELVRSGHYLIVAAAQKDVLRIKAEIRDLYLDALDLPPAGASQTYTICGSAMRLVTELRDAPTGALVARVVDFRKEEQSAWMTLSRPIDSIAAARQAATIWARIIRGQLDDAHGVGGNIRHAVESTPLSQTELSMPWVVALATTSVSRGGA